MYRIAGLLCALQVLFVTGSNAQTVSLCQNPTTFDCIVDNTPLCPPATNIIVTYPTLAAACAAVCDDTLQGTRCASRAINCPACTQGTRSAPK